MAGIKEFTENTKPVYEILQDLQNDKVINMEIQNAKCNEETIKYYRCRLQIELSSSFYAEYNIIDTTSMAKNAIKYIESTDGFEEIHKAVIGQKFYTYEGDKRYNIYFIIIVDSLQELLELTPKMREYIRNHYRSTRNLILTLEDANRFFAIHKVFYRLDNDKLDLTELRERYKKFTNINSVDKSIIENNKNEYCIKYLETLTMKSYRVFQSETIINFKQINLLTGVNGSGKTSTLEAIKKSILQEVQKNSLISLKFENKNGNTKKIQTPANEHEIISDMFTSILYPSATPEGRSALFGITNYFRSENTLEFADKNQCPHNVVLDHLFHNFKDVILEKRKNLTDLKVSFESFPKDYWDLTGVIEITKEHLNKLNENMEKMQENINNIINYNNINNNGILPSPDTEKIMKLKDLIRRLKNTERKIQIVFQSIEDTEKFKKDCEQKISNHISEIYYMLTNKRDYKKLDPTDQGITATRTIDDKQIPIADMSTGQRACFSLASIIALFASNPNAPNFLIFDEPTAYLDTQHFLNLLDILRQLAIRGTQIFFSSNNLQIEEMFRRKFSFFDDEFKEFAFLEEGQIELKN